MSRLFYIRLSDLEFHSRIGVFDQEREIGNDFIVNVELCYDASGFETENLDTSISYAEVYECISQEMKKEWLLLESVAKQIGDCIGSRWVQIENCRVEVIKRSVPLSGIIGTCGVTYQFER